MYQVIYLTGAPATGKSTLSAEVHRSRPDFRVFTYNRELAKQVGLRIGRDDISDDELRKLSSSIVTHDDVVRTDQALSALLAECRGASHVLIDSHAVTKESYGFRVTPFSTETLSKIRPTVIMCLVLSAEDVRDRIRGNAAGRPLISEFEADFHTQLQAAVAFAYGFSLGIPIYYVDSGKPTAQLAAEVLRHID